MAFVVFNIISKFITFSGGQAFDENKMNSIIMFVSGFILDFVPIIIVILATGMTVPEKLSKIQSLSQSVLRRRSGEKLNIKTRIE